MSASSEKASSSATLNDRGWKSGGKNSQREAVQGKA